MEAKELRIGNLIYNTRGEVDKVNIDALKYIINYPNTLCQADPIPLTEEWLLKFGFVGSDFWYVSKSHSFIFDSLNLNLTTWGVSLTNRDDEVIIKTNCKYVHQLQNLVHSLTGEELTTKTI